MASINLGEHFEQFIQQQIAHGRYQNVSEVVRAGLRLLEDYEISTEERARQMKAKINEAWDDPRPSVPIDEVFDRLEMLHSQTMEAQRHDHP
ncbi:MAG: type II toxin-antitoxin system ParD family antitoxin [Candidatus Tectomicrobia bacterium]|uniref:Type II toxin-antitoxin system ParD family antitoxin n=1 Tax=Tectimicrobiota bacterium TaxID=2528274 RepID=A0A937W4D7_UNCTE|nr:type II toxin-antitoxin system ParD family antitoxin [Candidatus Tectomicrobia bacterium]